MKIRTIYEADDGKKFEDEDECLEYEAKLRAEKFADSAFFYDEDGCPLPLTADGCEQAYYIVADTIEAAEYIASEFKNLSNPWELNRKRSGPPGCWVYISDGWYSEEEILKMARIMKKIS